MKNTKKIFSIFLFILFVNKVFSQDNLHNFLEKLHSGNYVIDFYCDVLKSENRDTIHKYSDIYVDREFPDPDYFVVKYKWYDMQIFPMEKIYIRIDKSNNKIDDEYFEILDHGIHPRSFTIKQNIEICFEEDINNYLFDDKSTYDWAIARKNNVNTFYFNFDGDYLNIYLNGETDKDLFATFVNMNDETLLQFKNLIENNKCDLSKVTWPRHADGSCDYEDVSSIKTVSTPTTNVVPNKTMTVSENLKLRSGEATTSEVIDVMSAGTKVKILELGKAENIDGINSNWVKVEVLSGAKDRDGNTISRGTVGWCYGGYLAETTEVNNFESTDTKEISDIKIEEAPKQEINIGIVCAIIGAVLLLLLVILIFAVRKKKDNP
jgi:hypothetical protein